MNIHSLRFRIAGFAALCLVGTTGAIVGFNVWSSKQKAEYVATSTRDLLDRTSRESLSRLAAHQAGLIRSEIDTAFAAARNMSKAMEALAISPDKGGAPIAERRRQLDGLLERVLIDNKLFNGTYSAWLPNALDGRDREFKGDKASGSRSRNAMGAGNATRD